MMKAFQGKNGRKREEIKKRRKGREKKLKGMKEGVWWAMRGKGEQYNYNNIVLEHINIFTSL